MRNSSTKTLAVIEGGSPATAADGLVPAIKRYIDLMAVDKIANPSNAEYAQNQSVSDFANGKVGMLLWQAADSSLKSHGMSPGDYGVAPVPFENTTPSEQDASTRPSWNCSW